MSDLFDEGAFQGLRSLLGDDSTAEALTTFLSDTGEKMARIAASSQTRPLLKREAHSIKSSAAALGFQSLSLCARDLEAQSDAYTEAELRASVQELRQRFEATRQFVQQSLLDAQSKLAI